MPPVATQFQPVELACSTWTLPSSRANRAEKMLDASASDAKTESVAKSDATRPSTNS